MKIQHLLENNINIIDNVNGWGSVPNNQNVDYLGLRVYMTPKNFTNLAAALDREPSEKIVQHIEQGGTIGSPFLIIKIPESWEIGDFSMPARVSGHEGRNRMLAIARVFGNNPIETHLFFRGLRNRHITDEFKKHLNIRLIKENSDVEIKGPFFELNESIPNFKPDILRKENRTALEQAILEGGHTLDENSIRKPKYKTSIYSTLISEKYKHGDYARGGQPMPKAKKGRTQHPLHGKLVG
jgi:hypothetical protein